MWARRPSSGASSRLTGGSSQQQTIHLSAQLPSFEKQLQELQELTGFSLSEWRKEHRIVRRAPSRPASGAQNARGPQRVPSALRRAAQSPASFLDSPRAGSAAARPGSAASSALRSVSARDENGVPVERRRPSGDASAEQELAQLDLPANDEIRPVPAAVSRPAKATPTNKGPSRGETPHGQPPHAAPATATAAAALHKPLRVGKRLKVLPKLRPGSGARRMPMASRDSIQAKAEALAWALGLQQPRPSTASPPPPEEPPLRPSSPGDPSLAPVPSWTPAPPLPHPLYPSGPMPQYPPVPPKQRAQSPGPSGSPYPGSRSPSPGPRTPTPPPAFPRATTPQLHFPPPPERSSQSMRHVSVAERPPSSPTDRRPSVSEGSSPPAPRRKSVSVPELFFTDPPDLPPPNTSRRGSVTARRRPSVAAADDFVVLAPVMGISHAAGLPAVTSAGILPPSVVSRRAHDPRAAAAAAAGASAPIDLPPSLLAFAHQIPGEEELLPPLEPTGVVPPRSIGGTSAFNRVHIFSAYHPVCVSAVQAVDAVFNTRSGMSEDRNFTKGTRIKLLKPKGSARPETAPSASEQAGLPRRPATSELSFRLRNRLHPGEAPPAPPPPRPFVISASSSVNELVFTRPRYVAIN